MLTLHRVPFQDADWPRMDAMPDRVVFQTREWLEFVATTQRAEPVLAVVHDGATDAGYFTGLLIKRFGVRILGSPFPGWATDYLGFNLATGVNRRAAAEALIRFAFGPLRALHVELCDRYLRPEDLHGSRFEIDCSHRTFVIDLTGDEADVFAHMTSACRRAVRKGVKVGVHVEVASGQSFADEYYEQLRAVFARQSLVPTYSVQLVRQLIRHLEGTDRLLLLRALDPDDRPIATSIFLAFNDTAHFWGGASVREHQILRPNEAMFWYAMRWAREKGCSTMDMGGGGEYKRRYGAQELRVPRFRCSRMPFLAVLRNAAEAMVDARQSLRGRREARTIASNISAAGPRANVSDRRRRAANHRTTGDVAHTGSKRPGPGPLP
jgi:CelD/BcsL family acetyltransferase involved in cellulose biosynthesis